MKAAVCYEFGSPLVIEEVTMRAPHSDEVKVKVAATAICHSDLHDIHGDFGGGLPLSSAATRPRDTSRRSAPMSRGSSPVTR